MLFYCMSTWERYFLFTICEGEGAVSNIPLLINYRILLSSVKEYSDPKTYFVSTAAPSSDKGTTMQFFLFLLFLFANEKQVENNVGRVSEARSLVFSP